MNANEQQDSALSQFFKRPDIIKAKGYGKIIFGALVILQPHYALMIGAGICLAGVSAITVQKLKGKTWEQIWEDKYKDAKDIAGMSAGAALGLVAPYAGIALAGAGVLNYLSGRGGFEGISQGGVMAVAVGSVALPFVGGIIVVEGIANAVTGKDLPIIGKSIELSKNLLVGVGTLIGVAHNNPDKPVKALNEGINMASSAKTTINPMLEKANEEAKKLTNDINKTVQDSNLENKTKKSFVDRLLGRDSSGGPNLGV
jgi:hypothetical protein